MTPTPKDLFPRWQKRLLLAAALGLGLTGMGQMPIFSRYYIADIPGLGWLGDYRVTAAAHLALATALLFVLCAMATGAIAPMHAPSATHSAAFLKVLLFIPVSLPQWC